MRTQHNNDRDQNWCGACGKLCGTVTHTWSEAEEAWGAPAYRQESETLSDCCNETAEPLTQQEIEQQEAAA